MSTELLHTARQLLAAGQRDAARTMLMQLLRAQPSNNAEAWHLLGQAVDDPRQQADCVARAAAAGWSAAAMTPPAPAPRPPLPSPMPRPSAPVPPPSSAPTPSAPVPPPSSAPTPSAPGPVTPPAPTPSAPVPSGPLLNPARFTAAMPAPAAAPATSRPARLRKSLLIGGVLAMILLAGGLGAGLRLVLLRPTAALVAAPTATDTPTAAPRPIRTATATAVPPTATRRVTPTAAPRPTRTATPRPTLTASAVPPAAGAKQPAANAMSLVYSRAVGPRSGGQRNIFIRNASGSQVREVVSLPGSNQFPRWSPDGTRLVFESTTNSPRPGGCFAAIRDETCRFDIYTVRADGTDLRRLTTEGFENRTPSWSQDGNWIFYSSQRRINGCLCRQIFMVTTDGATTLQVSVTYGSDMHPASSPGGELLVFDRRVQTTQDLLILDRRTSQLVQLTNGYGLINSTAPSWSPAGREIAYISYILASPDLNFDTTEETLKIIDVDGSHERTISVPVRVDTSYPPAWSDDGQTLTFVGGDGDIFDLYMVNRDGSGFQRLTGHDSRYLGPDWQITPRSVPSGPVARRFGPDLE